MTAGFRLAPQAERDVAEIAAYIERNSPVAANKLVSELYDCFARLASRPGMGHRRPDLTDLPVLFWPVRRRYLIVYRNEHEVVEIARVLSAYRDVAVILARSGV